MNNSKLTHRFTHLNFDGILVVFYAKNTRDFSIVIIWLEKNQQKLENISVPVGLQIVVEDKSGWIRLYATKFV